MSVAAYAALTVAASAAAAEPVELASVLIAQIRIQRSTIVRVPPAAPPPRPVKWKEKGGPNCLRFTAMAGALVSSPTTIDLILRGGTRYRVKLEKSCQAIDFYSGFYVKQTKDGQICEDRDMIHSRSGGECGIDNFKMLVPDK